MTITNNQRILVSVVLVALMVALVRFGGAYSLLGTIFLPLTLWLNLKREPEERRIRPAIRVLGWIFVSVAVAILVVAVMAIAFGR